MVNNDLMSIANTRPLKSWKETLALFCTVSLQFPINKVGVCKAPKCGCILPNYMKIQFLRPKIYSTLLAAFHSDYLED